MAARAIALVAVVDFTFPTEMIRPDSEKAYATNFRTGVLRNPEAQATLQRMPGLLDTIVHPAISKLDQVLTVLKFARLDWLRRED